MARTAVSGIIVFGAVYILGALSLNLLNSRLNVAAARPDAYRGDIRPDSGEASILELRTANIGLEGRLASGSGTQEGWGYYGEYPPEKWPYFGDRRLNQCGGRRQSPVNIDTNRLQRITSLPPLRLGGYEQEIVEAKIAVTTTGAGYHDLDQVARNISGGPLKGIYRLSGFHVHWAESRSRGGAEHTINGKALPMELHAVHYKAMYGSMDEAIKHPDGIAVLGVLFEEDAYQSETSAHRMAKQLSASSGRSHSLVKRTHIHLKDFFVRPNHYYYYEGSLTTPMCNEVVQWLVFPHPIRISTNDMELIRALRDPNGRKIGHNFRPVQPLNGRIVSFSYRR